MTILRKPDQRAKEGGREEGAEQYERKRKGKGRRRRARRQDKPVASVACINSEQGLQPYANLSCTGNPSKGRLGSPPISLPLASWNHTEPITRCYSSFRLIYLAQT